MSGVPGGRAGWPTHGGCVWDGAAAAADGWRVMTLGTRTTSFLIFFTEYVVVCYEERVDPTTDHAAVLPLLAPPSATVPAPEPAPGHGGHSAGGASGASGAKSLPAPPRLRHRRPAIGATDVSGCPSRSLPWMCGTGPRTAGAPGTVSLGAASIGVPSDAIRPIRLSVQPVGTLPPRGRPPFARPPRTPAGR